MRKIAIVTGASRGFGRGIAKMLASKGNYIVFATARSKDSLEALKNEVIKSNSDGEIIPFVLDQNYDEQVIEFANFVTSSEKKIDLLVNSSYDGLKAMTPHFGKPFWERPISVYDGSMNVGVRSSYVLSKLIVPKMIENKKGLIIQISSYGGFTYLFDVAYGLAHAAMDRLSYEMATELLKYNVRAITVHPGGGKSEVASWPDGETPDYVAKGVLALIEKADENYLTKMNGKVVFTVDLAKKFGFTEVSDPGGLLNKGRSEFLEKVMKPIMKNQVQYNENAELPNYYDWNNEELANMFPGYKINK